MSYTVQTVEPTEFTAGDSVQWNRTLSAYSPADGWSLAYVLTGADTEVLAISASAAADNTSYEIRLAPATTLAYTAGRYDLIGRVTHTDGSRFEVYRAACIIRADPVTATPTLSYFERMLSAVEAKIEARVTADISSYTLEQQQVAREDLASLHALRNMYAAAVRKERSGPGSSGLRHAGMVRFGGVA